VKQKDDANFYVVGLEDDNGQLSSPLGARGGIWVPPEAKLELIEGEPYIFYPVPDDWPSTVPVQQLNFGELTNLGWTYKDDTDNLLDEFVNLESAAPKKVLRFAQKWGPLWVCTSHSKRGEVEAVSFIHPLGPLHGSLDHGLAWCSWTPAEAVSAFVREAKRVVAALRIFVSLMLGMKEEEEEKCWAELGFSGRLVFSEGTTADDKAFIKKLLLSKFVESRLTEVGFTIGPSLNAKSLLKIRLVSDLGFIRAVWLQVAQAMTGMRGIYTCDNCGKLYVREGRKPPKGRLNFCPDCGEGKRGSKRAYYRRKKNANLNLRRDEV
jgi:DNA-directed RNA polymerase subunit RPC12/RpoP